MLVINNKTKTLILNRNIKYKLKRGIKIDFEFTNPLYNQLFNIEKSFLAGDIIYIVGKLNKTYSNLFPQPGDKLDYTFTVGNIVEDLYE